MTEDILRTNRDVSIIEKYHIPIYGAQRDYYRLVGSGVLIELQSFKIFVTANHVAEGTDSEKFSRKHLFLPTQPLISAYMKDIMTTGEDKIDLAFGLLDDEAEQKLEGYNFLHFDNLNKGTKIESDSDIYFVGYPDSWNKSSQKYKNLKQFENKLFVYGTYSREDLYSKLSLSPNHYIACPFDKKNSVDKNEKQKTPPEPYGISGGGVWLFDKQSSEFKLAGIGIGIREEHKAVVAIRIHWLINFLMETLEKHPDYFNFSEPVLLSPEVTV